MALYDLVLQGSLILFDEYGDIKGYRFPGAKKDIDEFL
tara:strand:- start:36 stop:149 length:114 start_codon:yes stop_codon:yes gene_type:complete